MLRDHFRPEFLNRIDDVIIFHSLAKEHLTHIIDLQLEAVAKRLADKRISLRFTAKAKGVLADKGYDPQYGARPLRRAIQDLVLDELALQIVEGKIKEGDAVTVDATKEKIKITKNSPV
jgi:ATP-dependent Clp protease ATP-binding subunit ClpB